MCICIDLYIDQYIDKDLDDHLSFSIAACEQMPAWVKEKVKDELPLC